MLSEYIDKETMIETLKQHYENPELIDWDIVIENGREFDGYIAYPVSYGGWCWYLTDPITGIVMDILIGVENIEDYEMY